MENRILELHTVLQIGTGLPSAIFETWINETRFPSAIIGALFIETRSHSVNIENFVID